MAETKKIQRITACAFIHKDGKLFVARRADTKKFLPGKYELPGGHIEFGETIEEGLKREIKEEFRSDVHIGEPFNVFTYTRDNDTVHSIEVDYFVTLADPNQNIKLNPEEHSEFQWISQAEILIFFEEDDEEGRAIKKGFEVLHGKN